MAEAQEHPVAARIVQASYELIPARISISTATNDPTLIDESVRRLLVSAASYVQGAMYQLTMAYLLYAEQAGGITSSEDLDRAASEMLASMQLLREAHKLPPLAIEDTACEGTSIG